jgi:hypothetical protein
MSTNQLQTVLAENEYEYVEDLQGACIHCLIIGSTCAAEHPTAYQKILIKKLSLAA